MDPLTVFPPEIVEKIWVLLRPADLLSARAVASHWLQSINDCHSAWVTDFSRDWTEYLAVKKTVRGWSSKKFREQTAKNVKGAVFTEFAYYLLFTSGTLTMFSPKGDPVRVFHRPATDVHRGEKCLLIGVDDASAGHQTIVTDFVLNNLDVMHDIKILDSSPNGYRFQHCGNCFLSLGPEIPGTLLFPCSPQGQIHFLTSCAILVEGFTTKTVRLFTGETRSFTTLKSAAVSPRWIPSIEISLGPGNYFAMTVEQRDFTTISVYCGSTVLFKDSYPLELTCFFTPDYFVNSTKLETFKLTDFTQSYYLFNGAFMDHYRVNSVTCEPWSWLKNTIVLADILDPLPWRVYQLSETTCESVATKCPENVKFQLTATLLAVIPSRDIILNDFVFCPRYAFRVGNDTIHTELTRQVQLVYFDI